MWQMLNTVLGASAAASPLPSTYRGGRRVNPDLEAAARLTGTGQGGETAEDAFVHRRRSHPGAAVDPAGPTSLGNADAAHGQVVSGPLPSGPSSHAMQRLSVTVPQEAAVSLHFESAPAGQRGMQQFPPPEDGGTLYPPATQPKAPAKQQLLPQQQQQHAQQHPVTSLAAHDQPGGLALKMSLGDVVVAGDGTAIIGRVGPAHAGAAAAAAQAPHQQQQQQAGKPPPKPPAGPQPPPHAQQHQRVIPACGVLGGVFAPGLFRHDSFPPQDQRVAEKPALPAKKRSLPASPCLQGPASANFDELRFLQLVGEGGFGKVGGGGRGGGGRQQQLHGAGRGAWALSAQPWSVHACMDVHYSSSTCAGARACGACMHARSKHPSAPVTSSALPAPQVFHGLWGDQHVAIKLAHPVAGQHDASQMVAE